MAEFIPLGLGGLRARPAPGRPSKRPAARQYERHELMPPPKPGRNVEPTDDMIDSLLERALAALARGMIWDRGSIINLVL